MRQKAARFGAEKSNDYRELMRFTAVFEAKITNLDQTASIASINGVEDGARTRDIRNHNPALYQLSYIHHDRCYGSNLIGRVTGCQYKRANFSRNWMAKC